MTPHKPDARSSAALADWRARMETKLDRLIEDVAEMKRDDKSTERRFQAIEKKMAVLTTAAALGGGTAGAALAPFLKLLF